MKRLLKIGGIGCLGLGVVIVALAALAGGSGGTGTTIATTSTDAATIRVSGQSGLAFSGSYLSVTSSGTSAQQSVDGAVPTEYQVTGTIFSATFQKKSPGAESLKVEILRAGKVIAQSETTAAYGVAAASSQ